MAQRIYRPLVLGCEALINDLARGLRAWQRSALSPKDLEALAQAGSVAVLRLAAVALFEARGLAPVERRAWSQRASVLRGPALSWKRLRSSWELLQEGPKRLGLEPYPGELFSEGLAPLLAEASLSVEDTTLERLATTLKSLTEAGADPSLLGGIYEALLAHGPHVSRRGAPIRLRADASRRRRRGSFFTPSYIVETIIEATLGRPLASARLVEDLLGLAVADPSCGSGHFLVGALRRLAQRWEELTGQSPEAEDLRVIAQSCLYGVDIDPLAVELTRASLMLEAGGSGWLDLTGNVRCGNALLGVTRSEMAQEPSANPAPLGLFSPSGLPPPAQGQAAERLADAHVAAAFGLMVPEREYRRALEQAVTGELKPDSYGWLTEAARLARRKRFFHWEIAFPEVFARGGFDAVVSNPPYVVASALPADERPFLSQRYTAPSDLYAMVLELGFRLLKAGGRLGLICPRFFCFNRSMAPLRDRLLCEGGLVAIIDAGRPFSGVQTECVILILQASRPTGQETCRLITWTEEGQTVRASSLPQSVFGRLPHSVFNLALSPEWVKLAEKLEAKGTRLGQICLSRRGMELGRGALVDDRRALPVLIGAEVSAFTPPRPAGRLDRFSPALEAYAGLVRRPWRVLVRRVASSLTATVDESGYHFLKNLYALVPRPGRRIGPYYLAACLNSRLLASYFHIWWTTKKARLFPEIQKYQLDGLPIVWEPEAPDTPEAVDALERFFAWLKHEEGSLEEGLELLGPRPPRPMLVAAAALLARRISALRQEALGETDELIYGLLTRGLLGLEEVEKALLGRTKTVSQDEWENLLSRAKEPPDEETQRELDEDFRCYKECLSVLEAETGRLRDLLDRLIYRIYELTPEEIELVETEGV